MLSEMESELEQGFDTLLSNSTLDNLHKIFKSTCDYLSLDSTKPQSSLFCHSNSANAKSYIASMFLRIINECSSLIWENTDLRHKVLRLLDEAYEGKIHKIVKLDIKSPSHVKYALYVALEGQILQDIENISNTIVSLETAISIREKYIKALRSPLSRIFLDTHIYNQSLVSTERVLEFFNAVEQYSNANRKEKLQSYQRLNEIKNTYQEDFKKNKTNKYSEKFLEVIINKISYLAMTDFNNSDFQSKANIKVIGSKRKYPLHIQDKFFQIKGLLVNEGPGISYNTIVSIIGFDSPLSIETEELNLGDLDVGQYEFVLKGKTTSPTEVPPTIIGQVGYLDYENKEYDTEFEINLIPQNSDVDWDNIKYKQPYSLESVDNESELIGRKDLLETITEKLRLNKMESSIIHGQKRVGKTSLARTIQNRFSENSNYLRIFIETGSLDKSSPNMFIKSLGEKVIKYIKLNLNDPTVKSIHTDGFNGSLHPLVSFVEDLMIVCEKIKIIIVIDEFDEIPAKLYPYTESGDAFFHSLRSLSGASSDGRLSLILVGGENMSVVMQTTDKLNKFDAYNVGYFDKSKSWKQFSELVTSPVEGVMEYSEEAILSLYEVTEGNPFYTKFIAKNLYNEMAKNHNSYISSDEMNKSIMDTMVNMEAINLNHFWSDCIRVEDQESRDLIETHRRKFLIAFAEEKRNSGCVHKESLLNNKIIKGIPSEEILDSFLSRNILVYEDDYFRIKPKLFEDWLTEKGMQSLIASFSDSQALDSYQKKEEKLYIHDTEISTLVQKWDLYRGQKICDSQVRDWLNQFQNNKEKIVAFELLKNISFYSEVKIREKLSVIHEAIRRRIVFSHEKSKKVRKDIVISCLGTASKSGATTLRMYASENKITTHNIKNFSDIKKTITADQNISAIVFVDDMLATGGSIVSGLKELEDQCGDLISSRGIVVVVGVICGMIDGVEKLENETFSFDVESVVCDVLPTESKVFSEKSDVFKDESERKFAATVSSKYGTQLQKMHPLGYEDSQLLIVFKDNCPNNSLPILWCSSNKPKWTPLFPRN
jgi:AAA+ ATPase superfamily predicted ATPase